MKKMSMLFIGCWALFSTLFAQNWQYLGQTPPGNTPVLFPPADFQANAEWFWHGVPAFSPDGKEMYFVKYQTAINKHSIWFTKYENGNWSAPALAPFSLADNWDNNPFFLKSSDTLYFHSARPQPNIYRVIRSNGTWSSPVSLNLSIPSGKTMGLQFSIAENGNIYSELENTQGNSELYRWKKTATGWAAPVLLSGVNSPDYDSFPTIDSRERFLLFSSNREPGTNTFDIFVSYKTGDNSWTSPQNLSLGTIIPQSTGWTGLTLDGNYLFFTKYNSIGYNPYWIKAQFLYDMNPQNQYFGQTPPGMIPEKFASGIVSINGHTEYSIVFTSDGKEMFFDRRDTSDVNYFTRLFTSNCYSGSWSDPVEFSVSSGFSAYETCISDDNNRLYFMWRNPNPSSYFFVDRTANGWSVPVYAGQGMWMSTDNSGNFYTTDMRYASSQGKIYLAKLDINHGLFTDYQRLTIQPNFGNQAHPCISRDGSFIIFDLWGEDLYVSFKKPDGTWDTAIRLADHGFDSKAGGAYNSPDGKYLFFHLNGDIWWVNADVIKQLNPYVGIDDSGSNSPNGIELFQNYPNPFNPETTITFSLPKAMPVEISIYNVKGEQVAKHIYRKYTSGNHSIRFDAGSLNSGHYFYRLKAGDYTAVKKMMVLK